MFDYHTTNTTSLWQLNILVGFHSALNFKTGIHKHKLSMKKSKTLITVVIIKIIKLN